MLAHFDFTIYTSAFFLALLGSGHCFGMCGSISAIAGSKNVLGYQFGRLLGYILIGTIFGAFGKSVLQFMELHPEYGLILFLLIVLALVFQVVQILRGSIDQSWVMVTYRRVYSILVSPALASFFKKSQGFGFGILSSLLPCGLIVAFMLAAAASGSAFKGAVIFAMLWLGSVPALLAAASIWKKLKNSKLQKVFAVLILVLSVVGVTQRWSSAMMVGKDGNSQNVKLICGPH